MSSILIPTIRNDTNYNPLSQLYIYSPFKSNSQYKKSHISLHDSFQNYLFNFPDKNLIQLVNCNFLQLHIIPFIFLEMFYNLFFGIFHLIYKWICTKMFQLMKLKYLIRNPNSAKNTFPCELGNNPVERLVIIIQHIANILAGYFLAVMFYNPIVNTPTAKARWLPIL